MSDISAGSLVRELRQRAGLTQQELARRGGTSQPALARLEAGGGSATLATLQRLAAAAGFELELSLVERSDPDPLIARYRQDIDRTLLRRNLGLTVDQRIRELARLQAFHEEVHRATRRARKAGGGR
jgi:transcriptional regulator with XRE-family HTH domain